MAFVQGEFCTKEADRKRYNYIWNKKLTAILINDLF